MMDTASNAGPRFAFEGYTGNFPHVVPRVPAPKFPTDVDEADAEEGEFEVGDAMAAGGMDEALEDVELVLDEGSVDGDDEVEVAEASDAEDRTLGQKVLLHVCTSVGEHCQL